MTYSTHSVYMKLTAWVVLISFSTLILQPTVTAAQTLYADTEQTMATSKPAAVPTFPATLQALASELETLATTLDTPSDLRTGDRVDITVLNDLRQQLIALDQYAQQAFAETAAHLMTQGLPAAIVERHTAAVALYTEQRDTLYAYLDTLTTTTELTALQTSLAETQAFVSTLTQYGQPAPFDPTQLPFGSPTVTPEPAETLEQQSHYTPFDYAEPIYWASLQGLMMLPMLQVAPPLPTDLGETEEVQITEAIAALAEALDYNPVNIFNWVHDNIEFVPTHGSLQGAHMVLETHKGNAIDTASLLIALLRASDIPARYATGTVMIPIENVMNWVGGVTDPGAAVQLLLQGGLKATIIKQNGVIRFAKLEHVWVEAWIDYYPSRGAVHRQGDSWVPLDASFKQYAYTESLDYESGISANLSDTDSLIEQLFDIASFNSTEGWVSGIDHNLINTTLDNYHAEVDAYFADVPGSQILGTKLIQPTNRFQLTMSLPYKVLSRDTTYGELPDNFRGKFTYRLYANESARILNNPLLAYEESLPTLSGSWISLSFRAATEADAQVIDSYLPQEDEDAIDFTSLSTALPGYLIKLVAELKVDGDVVADSPPLTLGDELSSVTGITRLIGGMNEAINKPIVGEFYGIGLDLTGHVTSHELKPALDGSLEDVLSRAALNYFNVNNTALKSLLDAVAYRHPSFGTFSINFSTTYSFGVPHEVEATGILVDMDVVQQSLWAKNNDADLSRSLGYMIGMSISMMEHVVPNTYFLNRDYWNDGVSSVQALAAAVAEGQRLYSIDASNVGSILPLLNIDGAIKSDIRKAAAIGQRAFISERTVKIGSWEGIGYQIYDPATGSGAYRISGGSNGGETIFDFENLGFDIDLPDFKKAKLGTLMKSIGRPLERIAPVFVVAELLDVVECSPLEVRLQVIHSVLEYIQRLMMSITRVPTSTSLIGLMTGVAYVAIASTVLAHMTPIILEAIDDSLKGCLPKAIHSMMTTKGKFMNQVTDHINDALQSGLEAKLRTNQYLDSGSEPSRSWMFKKEECSDQAKLDAIAKYSDPEVACDEYPFAMTEQGGKDNEATNSVRYVTRHHSNRHGGYIGSFFKFCGTHSTRPNTTKTTGKGQKWIWRGEKFRVVVDYGAVKSYCCNAYNEQCSPKAKIGQKDRCNGKVKKKARKKGGKKK